MVHGHKRGTSLIRKLPPLGPPWDPRHSPTGGSWEGSYRGVEADGGLGAGGGVLGGGPANDASGPRHSISVGP